MCPSTNQRKYSEGAKQRAIDKYIRVSDEENPYNMYVPIKKLSNDLREMLKGKNYIRIMTQLDKYQYIVAQYYWYSELDMWVCGDALVFNNNPEKKIWLNVICIARKDFCLCYNEDYKEFVSVCPNCKKVALFVKDTPWECSHCHFKITWNLVNELPYAKIPCEWCPKAIGWDKVQEIKELVYSKLMLRTEVSRKLQSEKIDELFKEYQKDFERLSDEKDENSK